MPTSTVIATGAATAGAAVLGSASSKRGVQNWYPSLRKPRYIPPNGVFPLAWTTIYTVIAVASASAIDRLRSTGDDAGRRRYIAVLASNLAVNAAWSWLFFSRHKLGASALGAAALTVSSAELTRRTARADPVAGLALSAYPAWCGFATAMSTDIWRLNR